MANAYLDNLFRTAQQKVAEAKKQLDAAVAEFAQVRADRDTVHGRTSTYTRRRYCSLPEAWYRITDWQILESVMNSPGGCTNPANVYAARTRQIDQIAIADLNLLSQLNARVESLRSDVNSKSERLDAAKAELAQVQAQINEDRLNNPSPADIARKQQEESDKFKRNLIAAGVGTAIAVVVIIVIARVSKKPKNSKSTKK